MGGTYHPWAMYSAEARQLQYLVEHFRSCKTAWKWDCEFSNDDSTGTRARDRIYFAIHPENDGFFVYAEEFWIDVTPEHVVLDTVYEQDYFCQGFVEGAVAVGLHLEADD